MKHSILSDFLELNSVSRNTSLEFIKAISYQYDFFFLVLDLETEQVLIWLQQGLSLVPQGSNQCSPASLIIDFPSPAFNSF